MKRLQKLFECDCIRALVTKKPPVVLRPSEMILSQRRIYAFLEAVSAKLMSALNRLFYTLFNSRKNAHSNFGKRILFGLIAVVFKLHTLSFQLRIFCVQKRYFFRSGGRFGFVFG